MLSRRIFLRERPSPTYIPRDHDDVINNYLTHGASFIVVGSRHSGKSRAILEGLRTPARRGFSVSVLREKVRLPESSDFETGPSVVAAAIPLGWSLNLQALARGIWPRRQVVVIEDFHHRCADHEFMRLYQDLRESSTVLVATCPPDEYERIEEDSDSTYYKASDIFGDRVVRIAPIAAADAAQLAQRLDVAWIPTGFDGTIGWLAMGVGEQQALRGELTAPAAALLSAMWELDLCGLSAGDASFLEDDVMRVSVAERSELEFAKGLSELVDKGLAERGDGTVRVDRSWLRTSYRESTGDGKAGPIVLDGVINKLHHLFREDWDALWRMASVARRGGAHEAALKLLERIHQGQDSLFALLMMGQVRGLQRKWNEAIDLATTVLERSGRIRGGRRRRLQCYAHTNLANYLRRQHDNDPLPEVADEIVGHFTAASRVLPEYAPAWHGLGAHYVAAARRLSETDKTREAYASAAESFRRAVSLERGRNPVTAMNLAKALGRSEKSEEALKVLDDLGKRAATPFERATVLKEKATNLIELGQWDEAIGTAKEATTHFPAMAEAWGAIVFAQLRRLQRLTPDGLQELRGQVMAALLKADQRIVKRLVRSSVCGWFRRRLEDDAFADLQDFRMDVGHWNDALASVTDPLTVEGVREWILRRRPDFARKPGFRRVFSEDGV